MKKQENVVIKKESHSRTPLSGIYNARRCQTKENALLNGCVEDPRQRHSGMTTLLIFIILQVQFLSVFGTVVETGYFSLAKVSVSSKAAKLGYNANGIANRMRCTKCLPFYMANYGCYVQSNLLNSSVSAVFIGFHKREN